MINSNIWVAFCALSLTLSSAILLQTSNFYISQFVFFATLFIYNFQRAVRIKKGCNHSRKEWLIKNRKTINFLMLFAFFIISYHFYNFKFSTQIAIVFIAFFAFMYPFGFRKIPFAKIFIISFVWAISSVLFLVLENEIILTQNIILHLVSRFLFVFAITIPFDIRDLKYDIANVNTIPLFFGQKKAKWIANSALSICVIIAIFQKIQNSISFSNFLALILLYFLASVLIIKSDKKNNAMYFSFLVESLSFFCYLFLVIMLLIV